MEDIHLLWNLRYVLWFSKSWFFLQVHGWTRIRDLNLDSLRANPVRPCQHCWIQTHQFATFRAWHSKMQIPIPGLNCFSDMNRQQEDETEENFGSYWALIKRLIKPRWQESAGWEGGWGKVCLSVEFCCPSALSPVRRASRPWILSSIAGSSHFQSGNKSGLYGPGGAHCSQCSPDGLLKGQITQRGHSSPRYVWSQHNSGGIGGLHSSMSSPPTHPPSPPASLHVWLSTGSTAIPHCLPARNLEASLSSLVYPLLQLDLFSFLSYFILSLWIFFLTLQFLQL